jgi:UDP-N-acetylmuramate dehydrogenase
LRAKGNTMKAVPGFSGRATEDVLLAEHTTLGVGGPAPLVLEPAGADDVRRALKALDELFVIGAGSNILVGDSGLDVPVLKMVNGLKDESVMSAGSLTVGAGRRLPVLARAAAEAGLSGLEWAVGIPGTVGGALVVNAGAFGSEMWEFVKTVEVALAGGESITVTPDAVSWGYRSTDFGVDKPFVITEVELMLASGDREAIRGLVSEYGDRRRESQPVGAASAGSFFKNPVGGPPAGKLVDDVGLKGARCGGAVVSDVHANFIVNEGGARADEVYTLAEYVRRAVAERYGIELEYEVELMGEFEYLGDEAVESGRV